MLDQSPEDECCRCGYSGTAWDRLGDHAVCPGCQVQLLLGEMAPLQLHLLEGICLACGADGTVPYATYTSEDELIPIDLCPAHFLDLLGRRLDRTAFRSIKARLRDAGLRIRDIFLLHEAFYDGKGRALQPVDVEEGP